MAEYLLMLGAVVVITEAVVEAGTMLVTRFDWKMLLAGFLGGAFTWLFNLDTLGVFGLVPVFASPLVSIIINVVINFAVFVRHSGNLNDALEWIANGAKRKTFGKKR